MAWIAAIAGFVVGVIVGAGIFIVWANNAMRGM